MYRQYQNRAAMRAQQGVCVWVMAHASGTTQPTQALYIRAAPRRKPYARSATSIYSSLRAWSRRAASGAIDDKPTALAPGLESITFSVRTLRNVLNTPQKPHKPPTPKAKQRPAPQGRVHTREEPSHRGRSDHARIRFHPISSVPLRLCGGTTRSNTGPIKRTTYEDNCERRAAKT